MPGRGPAPKPAATRRRRNKVVTEELPASAGAVGPPPLPDSYRLDSESGERPVEVSFLPETREWYRTFCGSPEATGLTALNFLRLRDVAQLQDRFYRTGSLKVQTELRLQLASFGATPADLRRTGREVKRPESKATAKGDAKSNVYRLRAVDLDDVAKG